MKKRANQSLFTFNVGQAMIPRILLCLLVCLSGCRDRATGESAVSILPPKALWEIDQQKTSDDFERILGDFQIRPRRGHLSSEEMLNLAVIFLQIDAVAETKKVATVCLPFSSDLFASLDASLSDSPGWWVLQRRAQVAGKIELFSVAAFIEASQRKNSRTR